MSSASNLRVRFDICLIISETPDVTFSVQEVENLMRREFLAYGMDIWLVRVTKKLETRYSGRKAWTPSPAPDEESPKTD